MKDQENLENKRNKNQSISLESQEIDISALFLSLGNLCNSIFALFIKSILYIRKIIFKHIILILICVVIASGLGLSVNYFQPDNYKSGMLIRSNILSKKLLSMSIDRLNKVCEEKDYDKLGKLLGIKPELASEIVSFSSAPFMSSKDAEFEELNWGLKSLKNDSLIDDFKMKLFKDYYHSFNVVIILNSANGYEKFTEPVLNYIKKIPFINKRRQIAEEQLRLTEKNIDSELLVLDSLRYLVFNQLERSNSGLKIGTNNVLIGDDKTVDPLLVIYRESLKYNEKLNIQKKLFLESDFELYHGFTNIVKVKLGYVKTGVIYGLMGFLISLIIIFIFQFNFYLNKVEASINKNI